LKDASDRGHQVTAIIRDVSKLQEKNIAIIEKNILELTSEDIKHFDVIVNAFGATLGKEQAHVNDALALIQVLNNTTTRAIIISGAGSLYVDKEKTIQVIDTPDFPDAFKPTARGQARNLQDLQETTGISWTFISPSAVFDPEGERTGSYVSGKDDLM